VTCRKTPPVVPSNRVVKKSSLGSRQDHSSRLRWAGGEHAHCSVR
jgi:hypothetical protein